VDGALFSLLFFFFAQIAAGVAPTRWPQSKSLAGLIFWISAAGTVACLIWYSYSQGWLMTAIDMVGQRYAGLLVLICGIAIGSLGLSMIAAGDRPPPKDAIANAPPTPAPDKLAVQSENKPAVQSEFPVRSDKPALIDLADNAEINIEGARAAGTGTLVKARGNAKGTLKDISATFSDAKFPLVPLGENDRALSHQQIRERLAQFSLELSGFGAKGEAVRDNEVERNAWENEFRSQYLPRGRTLQSVIISRIGAEPAMPRETDRDDIYEIDRILSVRRGRSSLGLDKPIGRQPVFAIVDYLRYIAERMPQ
jgi:hypothetical protein